MMAMDMKPDLWGTLPTEILHLVFSRLAVAEICQLRLLSKEWKRDIDTMDSEFSRVLEETTYPSMFGVIAWKDHGEFRGMVVDVKADRRHALEIDPADDYVITMGAADGGLVCFVSESRKRPLFLVVMNPLTRKKIELPGLLSVDGAVPNVQPTMVQLTMDRQTQQYKVIVVGYMETSGGRGLFAQVYNSETKGWSVLGSGEQQSRDRIFGSEHCWSEEHSEYYTAERVGPCLYDFAAGGLHFFGNRNVPSGPYAAIQAGPSIESFDFGISFGYALLNNRLFVVNSHCDKSLEYFYDYYISEYVLEKNATAWVKVGTISNLPFDDGESEYGNFSLHACSSFLMLFVDNSIGYICDLSTRCWCELPPIWPEPDDGNDDDSDDEYDLERDHDTLDLMCELRWYAIP